MNPLATRIHRARFGLRDARARACLLDAPPGPPDREGLVRFDLRVEAGRIAAIAPPATAPAEEPSPGGGQLWPCFVDAHTHLGKGYVWARVPNRAGDFVAPLPADFQPLLDRFFALAEARGPDLDLHLDEREQTGTRALRETLALMAEAGMRAVILPLCNLDLQNRRPGRPPRWRGVALAHEMQAAAIPVSLASDNTRDGFCAYGDLDMMEVYREATRILHLGHPCGAWPRAATAEPADAMGIAAGRLRVGAPADLVLFRARHMTELLSRPQSDHLVLRGGRVSDATLPDWRELDRWATPA